MDALTSIGAPDAADVLGVGVEMPDWSLALEGGILEDEGCYSEWTTKWTTEWTTNDTG